MTGRSAFAVSAVVLIAGCNSQRSKPDVESTRHPVAGSTSSQADWFVDRAAETGLDFVHFNGASGQFFYPEILPPGVALFDYDNDGDLDV